MKAGRTDRQAIWQAIRVEVKFGATDLAKLIYDGEATKGQLLSLREYLRALKRAGYLRELKRGRGMGDHGVESRFLLFRNTGPKSPKWSKRKCRVTDANTGEVFSATGHE